MKTTIRAAVMLTVLVVLPAAWIHFGPLPTGAQRVVDRVARLAREGLGLAPASTQRIAALSSQATRLGANATFLTEPEVEHDVSGSTRLATEATPSFTRDGAFVSPPTSAEKTARTAPIAGVEPLLAELRRLGVAQYELEHWGSSRKLYRFHCSMPLSLGADQTRYFESVASSALASVEQVVADVASWKTRRAEHQSVH